MKEKIIRWLERAAEMFCDFMFFVSNILLCIFLYVAMILAGVWFLSVMNPAHASTPATVTVIGIPASKRADCHQRRLFAESVAQARINGHSLDATQADAFLRAMNDGQTIHSACHVVHSVHHVWGIDGNVAGIGNAVYEQCIKEAM